MREDLRPYWIKKYYLKIVHSYTRHFLQSKCASFGAHEMIMKPWHVKISGPNIHIGKCFTAIGEPMHPIEIGVWGREAGQGAIRIGDFALLSPGVRISASDEIIIGDGVMMANGCYVTDSDWHTLYDRTRRSLTPTPVVLEKNVWLGDGVTVLKGVTVGENSVVAARSVVTRDIPKNTVVAGNPARIIKKLDADLGYITRGELFSDPSSVLSFYDAVDREVLSKNSLFKWISSLIWPSA
ncbi:MAG: acyltransferase [Halieaceae bacterium]|nr:acyltransferase [Halieaceae bacterium]